MLNCFYDIEFKTSTTRITSAQRSVFVFLLTVDTPDDPLNVLYLFYYKSTFNYFPVSIDTVFNCERYFIGCGPKILATAIPLGPPNPSLPLIKVV